MSTIAELLVQLQQTVQTSQETNPSAYFIEQILLLLNGGGGGGPRWPFGTGELGNVHIAADDPGFAGGDYETLTVDPGVKLTAALDAGIVYVRATKKITLAGATIDVSERFTQSRGKDTNSTFVLGGTANSGGGGGGGGGNAGPDAGNPGNQGSTLDVDFSSAIPYSFPTFANGGTGGAPGADAPNDATPGVPGTILPKWLLQLSEGAWESLVSGTTRGQPGGDGGFGGISGAGTAPGAGGNGGKFGGIGAGTIVLIAPEIDITGASLLATGGVGDDGSPGDPGTDDPGNAGGGGGGGGGSGAQGGGGGLLVVRAQTLTGQGSAIISVSNGAGGAPGAGGAGGTGAGTGLPGGAGAPGAAGAPGSPGVVLVQVIQ